MKTAAKTRTGQEVIEAILSSDTPAKKAQATRLQKEYIAQRTAEGKDPKKVLAGIRSRVNRLRDEEAKRKDAPKKGAKGGAARSK